MTSIMRTSTFVFFAVLVSMAANYSKAQPTLQPPNFPNILPEYPRPQMVRSKWLNLNGEWDFLQQKENTGELLKKGKILVPFPVESTLSGIGTAVGPDHLLTYSRTFTVPADWADQRILLHFGAVDYQTTVFVNNKKAGDHTGGYDPFFFDITDLLNPNGPQLLTVQATDPTDSGGQPIGKQRQRPGGIWYTAVSGIWQTVWLEPVPQTYIKYFRAEPDIDKNRLLVRVETDGTDSRQATVTARILQNGQRLSEAKGRAGTPLLLHFREGPRLWSPDDPYLYDLEIVLGNQKTDDAVKGYFGMRKTSVGPDENGNARLLLNNKPLFQTGVLDQGYYPDGLYTPPTEEAMIHDLTMMKDMGFNLLRKHVKIEPARWYHLCDKMGLLVWQDMPSATNATDDNRQQFKWQLKSMVDHLFHFPSIVAWVPFNEGWGQHDTPFYVEKLKEWDPTRPVNNASGWTDSGTGDILDIHAYPGPETPPRETTRATALGEFGGLGLNIPGHLWNAAGGWGYQLIESPEALLFEYEQLWWKLHLLKDTAALSAAIYTQLSDIETENNGLLTYDRKVAKIEPALVKAAHEGYMPPRPRSDIRIFVKNALVELATIQPGATIRYTLDGRVPTAKWLDYTGPITLKKGTELVCMATWPNGAKTRPQTYRFTKTKPLASKTPKDAPAGISVKIFDGPLQKLPDFAALQPSRTLTAKGFDLSEIGKDQHYAALYETVLAIEKTGVYTFHLTSDDGSRLWIGGQMLLDNDGLHGMKPMTGSMALKKGKHLLKLGFFQNEGGQGLQLKMIGPDGKEGRIGGQATEKK